MPQSCGHRPKCYRTRANASWQAKPGSLLEIFPTSQTQEQRIVSKTALESSSSPSKEPVVRSHICMYFSVNVLMLMELCMPAAFGDQPTQGKMRSRPKTLSPKLKPQPLNPIVYSQYDVATYHCNFHCNLGLNPLPSQADEKSERLLKKTQSLNPKPS